MMEEAAACRFRSAPSSGAWPSITTVASCRVEPSTVGAPRVGLGMGCPAPLAVDLYAATEV